MSICEMVKTQKWYYVRYMNLHISLLIGDCIERERAREREAMSICEMVKTKKWYYVHNMRSAYLHMIGDCIERESKREKGYVHP